MENRNRIRVWRAPSLRERHHPSGLQISPRFKDVTSERLNSTFAVVAPPLRPRPKRTVFFNFRRERE